jgi:hypothetical protein
MQITAVGLCKNGYLLFTVRRFGKIARSDRVFQHFQSQYKRLIDIVTVIANGDGVPYREYSSCLSVRLSAWNNSVLTGRIIMKLYIWVFFKKSAEKIHVSSKSDKNNSYFTRRPIHIFISRSFLLTMRNVSDKSCR